MLWAAGLGPVIAWVDDHLFICLPCNAIAEYNRVHTAKADTIARNRGRIKENGCWWFKGDTLADNSHKEFAEDCTHLIKDLISHHNTSSSSLHTYNFTHIDGITNHLGIQWELSKDMPFSSTPIFIGFIWDLERKTVALTPAKWVKYSNVIHEWLCTPAHTLEEVQKLHSQLSHASFVILDGSTYLMALQSMLGIFGSNPFMPHRQLQGTVSELCW